MKLNFNGFFRVHAKGLQLTECVSVCVSVESALWFDAVQHAAIFNFNMFTDVFTHDTHNSSDVLNEIWQINE